MKTIKITTITLIISFLTLFCSCKPKEAKPVIYLYPTEKQDVTVKLDLKGKLIADYPAISKNNTWTVTAYPDGKLINHTDKKEYSYLFWEGISDEQFSTDFKDGFVVKGDDVREFLQEKLAQLGLTPKEYNEFIVYWYPLMKDNPYNIIRFAQEEYTRTAPLTITPKPDAMLRVFMVFKKSDEKITLPEQKLKTFHRKGFTVIEWGGSNLDKSILF